MKNILEIEERPGSPGRWFGLAGVLLIAVSVWIALGLQSGGSLRKRSELQRVNWYLHSGQWRADIRTLVAAVTYVVDQDKRAQPKNFPSVTPEVGEATNHAITAILKINPDKSQVDLQASAASGQHFEFYH